MTIENLHALYLQSTGISTDTRKIIKGNIFFALKGENFNGNLFAEKAIEQGASYAIIDEEEFSNNNGKTILFDNVLKTLQKLAGYHRNYLKIPIIALTGSNGKTTTKELINAVLKEKYNTTATQGNLNNHIGVPLTLLSMNEKTEIGIVEMGANHPEEIAKLCNIAQPDYGYITNFGKAHLEGFGSIEGVIKAKSELYEYLKNNNKTVFVNKEDTIQVEKTKTIKSFSFGQKNTGADIEIKLLDANPYLKLNFFNTEIESKLLGHYNFLNIAVAIAIGNYFKVAENAIKKGIENYTPGNNRSQIINLGSNTIILDAYNANPSSMRAALENFNQLDAKGKIVILGDMFELGPDAATEHQNIVDYIEQLPLNHAFLVGENFFKTNTNSIKKFKNFEEFKSQLSNIRFENAHILIKGSRGMALERVLDQL
jgi:UDP-N-acetylmuramoyl-tripeptide--D-alanyl-D-alanine ligase